MFLLKAFIPALAVGGAGVGAGYINLEALEDVVDRHFYGTKYDSDGRPYNDKSSSPRPSQQQVGDYLKQIGVNYSGHIRTK